MKTKVYFSIPVSVDWDTVTNCVERLVDRFKVSYWKRGNYPYNPACVRDCDIFIIMLPKGKWNGEIDTLPSGVKKELREAIYLSKPVYLAYKPSTGIWEFYDTSIDTFGEGFISGLPGSSCKIYEKYLADEPVKTHAELKIEFREEFKSLLPLRDKRILLAYC